VTSAFCGRVRGAELHKIVRVRVCGWAVAGRSLLPRMADTVCVA